MTAFDKELQSVLNKLGKFRSSFKGKDYMKTLGEAAEPARDALKAEAPKSKKVHYIKEDEKWVKIRPGNLKRSMQIFQSKNKNAKSVMAGPVANKKSRIKSVPGIKRITRRNRAFYWRFIYYGTPKIAPDRFIDRARNISQAAVMRKLKTGIEKYASKTVKTLFN
jgi:HK97 gp10 family phage protein